MATTTDWRLYELLKKDHWRPGDEPPIRQKIVITYGERTIVIPLPNDPIKVEVDIDQSL